MAELKNINGEQNNQKNSVIFKDKVVLITGSGSLAKALLRRITGAKEIRIFSKNNDPFISKEYPRTKFILGKLEDYSVVRQAIKGIDIVIHTAAFKMLDLAEFQARECVLSNVFGSMFLLDAVKEEKNVKVCLGISTDKVPYARNVYGCTKAIMEKLFFEASRDYPKTKFCCVRYGNVIGTFGSVFEIWNKQKEEGKPITLTSKKMTRFFFTQDEAVDLIFYALGNTIGGEVFMKKMKGYKIWELAKRFSDKIIEVGIRQGEKLHECLFADYEFLNIETRGDFFILRFAPENYIEKLNWTSNQHLAKQEDYDNFIKNL